MNNLPTQEDWDKLYSPKGKFSVQKMFWELGTPETRRKYPPIFTLKDREHEGLPSAYQVYMDSVDEYEAALKIVPNMNVWDDLKKAKWFMDGTSPHAPSFDGLIVWRDHMKQRDVSEAKATLQKKAKSGDVTAAKAILADSKVKAPVGRKNKKVTPVEKASVTRIENFRKSQDK